LTCHADFTFRDRQFFRLSKQQIQRVNVSPAPIAAMLLLRNAAKQQAGAVALWAQGMQ
jgi:hypothetical protein